MLSLITKGILTERKSGDINYFLKTGDSITLDEIKGEININVMQEKIIDIDKRLMLIISKIENGDIKIDRFNRNISLRKVG